MRRVRRQRGGKCNGGDAANFKNGKRRKTEKRQRRQGGGDGGSVGGDGRESICGSSVFIGIVAAAVVVGVFVVIVRFDCVGIIVAVLAPVAELHLTPPSSATEWGEILR